VDFAHQLLVGFVHADKRELRVVWRMVNIEHIFHTHDKGGAAIGRIRMKRIPDASGGSLMAFIQEVIEPGTTVHTDGWQGYSTVEEKGYVHQVTVVKGKKESASERLPRIHLVASLLKRWVLGTHQGAVSHEHLEFYLDEFTFRFNRRRSKNRGKLFYRMVQQAVAIDPVPYKSMILCDGNSANRDHNL
jgi:transposase-like protein